MPFTVHKTTIPPPPVPPTFWWKEAPSQVLIVLVAIPVMLVGAAALLIGGAGYGLWQAGAEIILSIRKQFGYQPPPEAPPVLPEPEVMFQNAQIRLLTTEQEWDAMGRDFEMWLEHWTDVEHQCGNFAGLHRLQTEPEVVGLHGQLVSDLCREASEGLFLQLVEPRPGQNPAGTTWLVYLDFATLQWEQVTEVGEYYLLPAATETEPGLFEGIRPGWEQLELRVQTPG